MLILLSSLAFATPTPVDPTISVELELPPTTPGISWSLAFDVRKGPDGKLYLTNQDKVHTFDPVSGTVALFATAQSPDPDRYLYQVGWTSNGTMYASEYYGGVSAFSPTGAFLGYTPTTDCMIGLVVTPDDRIFTGTHCYGEIYEVNAMSGAATLDALMPFNPMYDRPGCVRLYGMALDQNGDPWTTDLGCNNWEYRRYDDGDSRPTDDRWELMYGGDFGVGYGLYYMTFMPDGTAFYSTYPGQVYRIPPGGTPELFATNVPSGGGVGLYYDDASGKLYSLGNDGLWSFQVDSPPATPSLIWSGTCPGPMRLDMSGMTPGGSIKILSSSQAGSVAVPAGPCAGTVSGLGPVGLHLRATRTADASGNAVLSVTMPAAACGAYTQALDVGSCTFSNVGLP